jgi:hypothetical protein
MKLVSVAAAANTGGSRKAAVHINMKPTISCRTDAVFIGDSPRERLDRRPLIACRRSL